MKVSSKFSAANYDQSDRRAVSRYGKRNGSRSYRGLALANIYRRAVRAQERDDCRTLVTEARERDYWWRWNCDACGASGYDPNDPGAGCTCGFGFLPGHPEYDPDSAEYLEDVDADVISALRDESSNWLRAS